MEQKPEKASPTPPPIDTIEGTLEGFTFRNPETGFAVVRFRPDGSSGRLSAVGHLAQLAEGQRLRLIGRRVDHPRFGPQIQVESFEAVLPTSVEGIRAFLASSLVRGIGPATAERITDQFGAETLRVIEEQPERLREVPGLGTKRIAELVESVRGQRDVQEVMVFLRAHGLGQALAARIVKRYGKGATALIQANPFRLADEVIGVGFRTADRLARELGLAADSRERVHAGTLHVLEQAVRDGHCFLPRGRLVESTAQLLDQPVSRVAEELADLRLQGRIRVDPGPELDPDGADSAVYPKLLDLAEQGVATRLAEMCAAEAADLAIDAVRACTEFELQSGMHLPVAQREAIHNALARPVSVITGGPGVGKTTIVRGLSDILRKHDRTLLLSAPTGRAAKRLEESTGHPASTVHRLLDWQVGTGRFLRDDQNPLQGDLLVLDEVSMLDIQLAYHLLRAIPPSMRLVLLGDVDQLPSVGPGQVLHDVIVSEVVAVTRLTEVFRQRGASSIVENAHALLRGSIPTSGPDDGDFFVIEARNNAHVRELVRELVARRIPRRFGFDPQSDIQVLCPMYRGHAGADAINQDLQDALNPTGHELARGSRRFREGDKVMQVRNDYELDLFNGDTGRIVSVDAGEGAVEVRFGERVIRYPSSDLDALVPAYAITVHRAQGSEYPAVVVPLTTDHYVMLRRNLLYTAITRGRSLVVLVGPARALEMAVQNHAQNDRHSGLAARLRARVAAP